MKAQLGNNCIITIIGDAIIEIKGYVIIILFIVLFRNLLSQEEVSKLKSALENEKGVMSQVYSRDDGSGRRSKTVLWNHPGNDLTGVIARCEKLAGTFEKVKCHIMTSICEENRNTSILLI